MTLHRPGRLVTLLLAAAALAAVPTLLPARAQEKGNRPEGKWHIKSLIESGKKAPDEVQALTFEFKGDRVTLSFFGKDSKSGAFKADPTKEPPQFEMELDGKGRQMLGIYKLEKDVLTLCFSEGSKERPTRFEAPKGSGMVLIVLGRGESKLDPALLKKAVEKVRLAAQRAQSQNNLKQIGLAMHNYHDAYKKLPTAAIYSKDGKPLLSWRVTILPYLEEGPLYQQFRLDEPWDSAHNKKLLEKMPKLYAPVRGMTKQPHTTFYQVFTGPGTLFEGNKALKFQQVQDGISNTILAVEAGEAVPWTKPDDLPYDPQKDLPKLGGLFAEGFSALFADGSVRWVGRRFDVPTLRLAITCNDGQPFDEKKLNP
jgi:uncharacterized protein (TIGR03067 family)